MKQFLELKTICSSFVAGNARLLSAGAEGRCYSTSMARASRVAQRDDSFLRTLQLAPFQKLSECQRQPCAGCTSSRKYYCYNCFLPVGMTRDDLPQITLPVSIDVVRHPKEGEGRSSSAQAKVLCPEQVRLFDYPRVPFYEDTSKVVLLFPSQSAVTLDDLSSAGPASPGTIERALFIDCTWAQTKRILNDERIKGLQQIKLDSFQTTFWRPQPGESDTSLATIEAMYWFVRQLHPFVIGESYKGQYDNLLYFYAYQHRLVSEALRQYEEGKECTGDDNQRLKSAEQSA